MTNKDKKKMSGQVVLMVLLASALILTLGLSASKITTTETQIDTDQELLKKAFNTAESGIDYYMATGETTYNAENESAAADLKVVDLGNTQTLSFNSVTMVGNQEYFWLVDHTDTGAIGTSYYSTANSTIKICTSEKVVSSLKIDYFYLVGVNYGVGRTIMDTGSDGCISSFDISNGAKKSLLLTVMPIDTASKLSINGSSPFPTQGKQISATGKVEGVNNTVTILDRYNVFLNEAVISGGNVTSQ